ncbi:MAG TPA: hypothetical protein DHV48_05525 [Prolixibacteraceae bacterium]|nr:hypothetical protein [Prolixibacteraceae bacterium]
MEFVKGMNIRTDILSYSLMVENFSSIFLSTLLDISDFKESKSLGNKSGNLSFNQKIDLLIDIKALDKKEKSKFQIFMSIRNQFMHNIAADNYENCLKNIDGAEKFLLKTYSQDNKLAKEIQLENATKELSKEVVEITINLLSKVKEKIEKEVKSQLFEKYQKNSIEAISKIETEFNSIYNEKVEKGVKMISLEELKQLVSEMRRLYYQIIDKTFK